MTIEHLNTTTTNKNGYKNFNLLTKPIKDYNHKKKVTITYLNMISTSNNQTWWTGKEH